MRSLLLAGLVALPAFARAQSVQLRIELPVVLPPLVVIQPGVQVVQDVDEEVFYSDGHYWVRQDGAWYRSRSHRSGWVLVPARAVPARLVQLPPGHYRRYRPAPAPAPVRVRPAPAPAPVYERRDRDDDRHHRDHDRDHDRGEHGRGKKKGHHERD